MPVIKTVRAVCISATCCSSERTPRTLADITEPIATTETAMIASAISTSMIVKPASRRSVGGDTARDNLDPSGQPVDTNFKSRIEPRQRDGPAARHPVGEKRNGRQRGLPVAGLRQQGIEVDVVGDADHV